MFLSHCQSVDEMGFNEGDEVSSKVLEKTVQPSFILCITFQVPKDGNDDCVKSAINLATNIYI